MIFKEKKSAHEHKMSSQQQKMLNRGGLTVASLPHEKKLITHYKLEIFQR